MTLFVKEVVSSDRVVAAVRNFADVSANECNLPNDPEQALLLWVTQACAALTKRVAAANASSSVNSTPASGSQSHSTVSHGFPINSFFPCGTRGLILVDVGAGRVRIECEERGDVGAAQVQRGARVGRFGRRRQPRRRPGLLLPGRGRLEVDGVQRAALHGRLRLQSGAGATLLLAHAALQHLPPQPRRYGLHARVSTLCLWHR